MGVSASQTKTSSRESGTSEQTYNDERAQTALNRLLGVATGEDNTSTDLSNFFRSQLGAGGNPYLDSIISSENALGEKTLKDNLALVRSGGYRGGAGRGAIDQGQFISNFAAQQAANNARLRAGDYGDTQGRRFQAAQGLSGTAGQSTGAATTLLNALRGTSTTGQSSGSSSTIGASANIGSLLGAI